MRLPIRSGLLAFALSSGLTLCAGCLGDGRSDDYSSHRYDDTYRSSDRYDSYDYNRARSASERQGDINTERSDIADDGRLNNSARSYEERKASRAADEGYPGAARREAEHREERLSR